MLPLQPPTDQCTLWKSVKLTIFCCYDRPCGGQAVRRMQSVERRSPTLDVMLAITEPRLSRPSRSTSWVIMRGPRAFVRNRCSMSSSVRLPRSAHLATPALLMRYCTHKGSISYPLSAPTLAYGWSDLLRLAQRDQCASAIRCTYYDRKRCLGRLTSTCLT